MMLKGYFLTIELWFTPVNTEYLSFCLGSLTVALLIQKLWGLMLRANIHVSCIFLQSDTQLYSEDWKC